MTEGAGLELKNVTTKEQVKRDMEALQWAILRREDVIEVLQDTERQVLAILVRRKKEKKIFLFKTETPDG